MTKENQNKLKWKELSEETQKEIRSSKTVQWWFGYQWNEVVSPCFLKEETYRGLTS